METNKRYIKKITIAWVLMVSALAVHISDEAVTGFLQFYNRMVGGLKQDLGFFPMPTFTFSIWLGGLIAFILLCFILTPVVKRGGKFIRIFVIALGIIMIANALGHTFGSVYFGKLLPGFLSSPTLLITAIYLLISEIKTSHRYKALQFKD